MPPPFLLHLLWKGSQACDLGWAGRRTLSWSKPSNKQKNYTTCYFRESSDVLHFLRWGNWDVLKDHSKQKQEIKDKSKPKHHVSSLLAWLYEAPLSPLARGLPLHMPDEVTTAGDRIFSGKRGWKFAGLCPGEKLSNLLCKRHVGQELGAVQEEHLKPHTSTKQGRPISRE